MLNSDQKPIIIKNSIGDKKAFQMKNKYWPVDGFDLAICFQSYNNAKLKQLGFEKPFDLTD